jgi:ESCRT-II complex subunit VPS36
MFIVFNRARGTELVSPDDFLQAAQNLGSLNIGIRYREFKSGVKSVHLDDISDSSALIQFNRLFQDPEFEKQGLNATIVAKKLNVSLIVAKEQLLTCELSGSLCRDESLQGIYFFPNLFITVYSK